MFRFSQNKTQSLRNAPNISCNDQCSCAADHVTRPVVSYAAVQLLQNSRFHLWQTKETSKFYKINAAIINNDINYFTDFIFNPYPANVEKMVSS